MVDLDAHAEALLPVGQEPLDAVDGGSLHEGDHDRGCEHGRAAAAQARRRMLLADHHRRRAEEAGLQRS